jgi:catechol 2,3-dioxygenase-like lactoylglutathione lyase family enzyme
MITLERLDHLVLTVASIDATTDFYVRVLGMKVIQFAEGRIALRFGHQKINLHQQGAEFDPKSARPTAGSADLCFLTTVPITDVVNHLVSSGVTVEEGPVERTGAEQPILSVYLRDPDGNLIEISNALPTHP